MLAHSHSSPLCMSMPSFFFFLTILLQCLSSSVSFKQTYIVNMRPQDKPLVFPTYRDWYLSGLQSISSTPDDLIYTYTDAYNGFAASLYPAQAEALCLSDCVIGVYEDTLYTLSTLSLGWRGIAIRISTTPHVMSLLASLILVFALSLKASMIMVFALSLKASAIQTRPEFLANGSVSANRVPILVLIFATRSSSVLDFSLEVTAWLLVVRF